MRELKRSRRDKQDHAAKEGDANKIDLTLSFYGCSQMESKNKNLRLRITEVNRFGGRFYLGRRSGLHLPESRIRATDLAAVLRIFRLGSELAIC